MERRGGGLAGRAGARWGRRRGAWPLFLAVAALVAGCAGEAAVNGAGGARDGAGTGRVHRCSDQRANYDPRWPDFPSDTAQDWVSYGDHVAVFHVRPGSTRVSGAKARRTRSAELVVDRVLSRRAGAPELPGRFRAPLWDVRCEPWILPGHTYVGVLVRDRVVETGGGERGGGKGGGGEGGGGERPRWRPVQLEGVLPYDHERIGTGEINGEGGVQDVKDLSPFGLARPFHGEHATTLQSLLLQTEPYRAASTHPKLSPGERARLVSAGREGNP